MGCSLIMISPFNDPAELAVTTDANGINPQFVQGGRYNRKSRTVIPVRTSLPVVKSNEMTKLRNFALS